MPDATIAPWWKGQGRIWLVGKIAYTAFVAVLVPFYWITYGPQNFLWFCDVALLMTVPALWLESSLWASVPAVGILLPQLLWIVDFLVVLFIGEPFLHLADYMFDGQIPLFVRALSSFHGWLPILLFWMVWKLGYDDRALLIQTVLADALLVASFFLTDFPPPPDDDPNRAVNVNKVFGIGNEAQTWMNQDVYLALQMIFYPLCVFLPTDLVLRFLCKAKTARAPETQAPEAPALAPDWHVQELSTSQTQPNPQAPEAEWRFKESGR
jgi:hypothetical protein